MKEKKPTPLYKQRAARFENDGENLTRNGPPRGSGLAGSGLIVKLLAVEPDSEFLVRSLEGQVLVTSELAQTEIFSVLLARKRAGKLSATDRRRAWQEFAERVKAKEIKIEPLNSVVLRKATHALDHCHPKVPLRTLDAIHLATVDLCRDFPPGNHGRPHARCCNPVGLRSFPPSTRNRKGAISRACQPGNHKP